MCVWQIYIVFSGLKSPCQHHAAGPAGCRKTSWRFYIQPINPLVVISFLSVGLKPVWTTTRGPSASCMTESWVRDLRKQKESTTVVLKETLSSVYWYASGLNTKLKLSNIMPSIPAKLIVGKASPKGEQSPLTLTLAMLFFLISKQMGKQSSSLFVALMKVLFRLLVDYLGGSAVSYFLKFWELSTVFSAHSLKNIFHKDTDSGVQVLTGSSSSSSDVQSKLKPLQSVWDNEWENHFRRNFPAGCNSKGWSWLQAEGAGDGPEDTEEVFVWHFQRYCMTLQNQTVNITSPFWFQYKNVCLKIL